MSVAPPKNKDLLHAAAARLSRAAPNGWKDFIDAFEAFSAERTRDCMRAPSDKVLVTQGKAQNSDELLTLFIDAAKQKV